MNMKSEFYYCCAAIILGATLAVSCKACFKQAFLLCRKNNLTPPPTRIKITALSSRPKRLFFVGE
ncbi:hypothetical protein ACFQ02_00270 [Seminibacterium arietis]|uniref:Secreted protein n=1 Tax=Seminibacterium arietis TaxID=1173502 RepID=A0ABW3I666_9PAST